MEILSQFSSMGWKLNFSESHLQHRFNLWNFNLMVWFDKVWCTVCSWLAIFLFTFWKIKVTLTLYASHKSLFRKKMSIEILWLVFLLFGENFFNWFQPFLFYPKSLSMPVKVLIGKLFFIFLMDALTKNRR